MSEAIQANGLRARDGKKLRTRGELRAKDERCRALSPVGFPDGCGENLEGNEVLERKNPMALVKSSSEKNRETIRDLMRLREEACARLTTLVIADLKNCGPAYLSASDGALMSAEPCNATLQVLSLLGFTSRKVRSRCQYLYFSKSSRCQYL